MIYEDEEQEYNESTEEKDTTEDSKEEIAESNEKDDSEYNEEESEDEEEEDSESLPFAKAEVVRLMKQNLDSDKMIRERVKVEMNNFLGDVLKNVCKQLNEYPYTTIEYEMLKESIYPYTNIKRINQEKERILLHLEAIKADCNALSMDVQKTLKLKDVVEEDSDFSDEVFEDADQSQATLD
ncbi:hypothetical protein MBFIL_12560 [Methanobrevibacter filiformis]|uniref:Uncharacterized protein n=1 Tax=Methanobrevibacter filiformis TaxID=55758 RepID=A0A166AH38_9EURY|nr:hypothetical protein MBFIL_12560 [Methanobrevibacter filiformis]